MAEYLNPNHLNVQISIAENFEEANRLDDAIFLYDKIAENFPRYWQVHIQKANALWSMGEKQKAYDLLNDLAEERPGDLQALSSLGRLYSIAEEYPEMAKNFDRLIGRITEPSQSDWWYYYRRGIAYERMGEWDVAEENFLEALRLSPEEPDVLNYLGYTWVDKGLNLEKAQIMLRTAVEARRTNGAIADSLGWAYFKLEKYDDAVRLLERAVYLEPTEAIIVEHLGDAYWHVGRKREARFQWNRALKWPTAEVDKDSVRKKLVQGL